MPQSGDKNDDGDMFDLLAWNYKLIDPGQSQAARADNASSNSHPKQGGEGLEAMLAPCMYSFHVALSVDELAALKPCQAPWLVLSGPLNRLNAILSLLSLLHALDRYRTCSATRTAIARPYLALSRIHAQVGVLHRLVLNCFGGSTAR